MKELSFMFVGLSIGMLYPIEYSKVYALIPLLLAIFFYYFNWIYDKGEMNK